MMVVEPKMKFFEAPICELCYLAALIDGEGAIEIHGRDLYPGIRIGMKSLLPLELCKKYGGVITKRYRRNAPFYTWNIYDTHNRKLLEDFVQSVMPHSKIKARQLGLMLEALNIRNAQPSGWKDAIRKIKAEISRLNKTAPPDIDLEK